MSKDFFKINYRKRKLRFTALTRLITFTTFLRFTSLRRIKKDGGINKICSFDGRTTQCYRNRLINEDNEVIILQIQTGCEGLNLQKKFSEIYFVSPNWNPFIEEQAIARCHRIGQEKMVNVYRFNMCDINEELISMDNYILNIQNEKREIVKQVI